MLDYKTILLETENHVATVTLNRPDVLNALGGGLIEEMSDTVRLLREDDDIRVVVITGAGRGFCAGADLRGVAQSQAASDGTSNAALRNITKRPLLNQLIHDLYSLEKPTIAAVNGPAVGGGLSLSLTCDIRIASERATFSAIFIKRAFVVDTGSSYFLTRLVGPSKAAELVFTGDMLDAQEAYRIGLVNRVVPHDDLMPQARDLAERIAKMPPVTLRLDKRALRQAMRSGDLWDALDTESYLNSVVSTYTAERREAVAAFLEKREAVF
jgi:2-(1,2-epoxy-1,2-dihydrophenyl)acetyl-CoA isomerase